jgi:hypothetical protein
LNRLVRGNVPQHQVFPARPPRQLLQAADLFELLFQAWRLDPVTLARVLHYRAARHAIATHEHGGADQAVVANDGDLRRVAVFHDVEQRDDAGGGKIHVVHGRAGLVDHRSERHRDEFKIWQQARIILGAQGRKKVVLRGVMR